MKTSMPWATLLCAALLPVSASAITATTNSPAGTRQREAPHADAGNFREVVEPSGCTGTIVGPYAVLTANHCGSVANIRIQGSHEPGGWANYQPNDWRYNPWLQESFWPEDWKALNDAQIAAGGRTDDWPAMHDQMVAFVPQFTSRWLADRGIVPAAIDPYGDTDALVLVGGMSASGGVDRLWGETRLMDANWLDITHDPRDFYLSRTCTIPGLVCSNSGDSGGPTLGVAPYLSVQTQWANPTAMFAYGLARFDAIAGYADAGRFVVGTTQNGAGAGALVSVADMAPLAYAFEQIAPTQQQLDTVRRNVVWVTYAIADADGDDITADCDLNPGAPSSAHNTCPPAVGNPKADLADTASGLLQCPTGYVATGVGGRSGSLVDQLMLECRPVSCVATGSCSQYQWTEPFGEDGGGSFLSVCPAGTVVTGLKGRKDADAGGVTGRMTGIRPVCGALSDVRALRAPVVSSSSTGNTIFGTSGTQSWSRACGNGKAMTALVVRTQDKRWVTGVSMVCSAEPAQAGLLAGVTGNLSRHPQPLSCPEGAVAIGSVQAGTATTVDMAGLVCAHQSLIGGALRDDQMVIIHGRAAENGNLWATRTTTMEGFDYTGYPNASFTLCPTGEYLTAARFKVNGFGTGINYFDAITCTASTTASKVRWPVGVGGNAGILKQSTCVGGRAATGMVVYSDVRTEGMALVCGP